MSLPGSGVDVLIVGGGPAGSAAAITCASAGLSVRVLERAAFPRDCPGESLHPGVEPLFEQLGVYAAVQAAQFIRYPGIWVEWEGPRQFIPFGEDAKGPWLGLQAWRAELDALLLERARALGVEVLQPRRALHPLRGQENEVVGVETEEGPISARVVIDAAGSTHWLARHLDIPRLQVSPKLVATYGYVQEPEESPVAKPFPQEPQSGKPPLPLGEGGGEGYGFPTASPEPRIVADNEGWTWTARVRPGVRQWTRLTLNGRPTPPEWRPSELLHLTPLGRPRGADVTWRRVLAPAGPGYLMIGDAAAVLDPASSHGVLKALMSGMMAGHAVARAATGAPPWRAAFTGYAEWLRRGFEHDAANLRARYRRFPGWAASRTPTGGGNGRSPDAAPPQAVGGIEEHGPPDEDEGDSVT